MHYAPFPYTRKSCFSIFVCFNYITVQIIGPQKAIQGCNNFLSEIKEMAEESPLPSWESS
jgi:hypothetical protein